MDLKKAVRDPWVWGQLVLFVVVALVAPLLPRRASLVAADHALNRIDPAWVRWCGGAVLAIGLTLMTWAGRELGPSLTPGIEPLPGAPLVTSGPYAYVRHPIYLGVVLLLAGYTLAWSNWTLALLVGVVALAYFEGKARAEERWLLQRYPAYRSYMAKVRRRVI